LYDEFGKSLGVYVVVSDVGLNSHDVWNQCGGVRIAMWFFGFAIA